MEGSSGGNRQPEDGAIGLWHSLRDLEDAPDQGFQAAELYHEASKQRFCDLSFYRRVDYFNRSELGRRLLERSGKYYVCAHRHPLPQAQAPELPLGEAMLRRSSVRRFSGAPIPLVLLASLLKSGTGVTEALREDGLPRRVVPSGGALYPTELYLLPLEGELPLGAYHYDPHTHEVAGFHDDPAEPMIANACATGLALPTAAAAIVITGCFERQRIKYGERAYRFTLLEAGHVMQNLLLTTAALGLAALPIAGFIDDCVNEYLGIDGRDEAALYLLLVGWPTEG